MHYIAKSIRSSAFTRLWTSSRTSTLLCKLSTRFRSVFMGIFDHSSRSAFVRSEGLARSLCSNSSQTCSIGLRSGLCSEYPSVSSPIAASSHITAPMSLQSYRTRSFIHSSWSIGEIKTDNALFRGCMPLPRSLHYMDIRDRELSKYLPKDANFCQTVLSE